MAEDVRMRGFRQRASVADAEALVLARVERLPSERVPYCASLGRALAEDVVAPYDVPPYPKATMDGYAVRAAETPGSLKVVGEIKAAERYDGVLTKRQAVRIMTGARVPEGADAVVAVEDTESTGTKVRVLGEASDGQHILRVGADLESGRIVLPRGKQLRAQDVAMLATIGVLEVSVVRRPRVRIVPTGTELVRAGASTAADATVESNSIMLEALAMRDGAEPSVHPIVPDDAKQLASILRAPGAEVVVVTGGSSVGIEDFAPVVLREIGELAIHGISVRPGSPTGIGFVGDTLCVLAPGLPVASYVAWDLFVRPAVQRMGGRKIELPYRSVRAELAMAHEKPSERVEIQRVTLNERAGGGSLAFILPGGAALLSTLTRADGFLYLPAGEARFEAGREVDVYLYP